MVGSSCGRYRRGAMSDLAQEVRRLAPWYHTFELPGGVVTDGYFDLRGVAGRLPLQLAGRQALSGRGRLRGFLVL